MVSRWLRTWPNWAGYTVAAWSLLYGFAGLYWTVSGRGYPFAKTADDLSSASILEPSSVDVVGPVIVALGLVGAVLGVLMARGVGHGGVRQVMLAVGWLQAVVFALLVPDYTLIAFVAFAPLLLVFTFTGVPGPQDGVSDLIYWHRGNLIIIFVGGALWALATLAYQRRTGHSCAHCGRGERAAAKWITPEAARRWGQRAVWIALAATIPYDITRLAWYFGWPLGITDEFLLDMQNTPGMLELGLGLGLASAGGAILSHGLIARWGETWPRWIPGKAGKRIHPLTAIIPAGIVSVVLIPAGLMNVRLTFSQDMWGTSGPGTLWSIWGLALGAATLAYYLRRRSACRVCGRGVPTKEHVLAG